MVNLNSLIPAVKNLIYSQHFEESTDINKLNALLKFDRVVMEVLAEALEAKAANDCNPFFVSNLFRWYSTYIRCFELLLQTSKLAEVSKEERNAILGMLQGLTDIEEADDIIGRLRGLPALQQEPVVVHRPVDEIVAELKDVFVELETTSEAPAGGTTIDVVSITGETTHPVSGTEKNQLDNAAEGVKTGNKRKRATGKSKITK